MKRWVAAVAFAMACDRGPNAHDLAAPDCKQSVDMVNAGTCVPRFKQCLAPAMCCPGLECVGGACAKVSP